MADLYHHAILPGQRQKSVGFLESSRDGLFDEYVLAALDRSTGNSEVCRCRNDDDDRVRLLEQTIESRVAAHPKILLDFLAALGFCLDEPRELNRPQVAQNSYVVETETARADDSHARSFRQITTPRSLASTNWISSRTSDDASISF